MTTISTQVGGNIVLGTNNIPDVLLVTEGGAIQAGDKQSYAVTSDVAGNVILNDGLIEGFVGSASSGAGAGPPDPTGLILGAGTVQNNGIIEGQLAISESGGTLTNDGIIAGTVSDGVNESGGLLLNNSNITGAMDGVAITGGTATNEAAGLISGGSYGVSDSGSFTNAGTISSTGYGVGLLNGTLQDTGTISGGLGSVQFEGGGVLDVGSGAVFNGSLSGFDGTDVIDITNLTATQVAQDFGATTITSSPGGVITFAGSSTGETLKTPTDGTLNLSGNFAGENIVLTPDGSGGTDITVEAACYVRGTHIATARGPVMIEQLSLDDVVLTATGGSRPVRWTGHRRVNIASHPSSAAVAPVCVAANAFGAGLPIRDLWLSPGHNIVFQGSLMPISALLNGVTVRQVMRETVEYWHVELDAHDIVLAEGLPAESYLDTGNRNHFANGGAFIEQHPDFKPRHWADTCLPLVFSGPEVVRAKALLRAQAEAAGHVVTRDSALMVIADDYRIEVHQSNERTFHARLPSDCRHIELRSRTFIPAQVNPESGDGRVLGLCVASLRIDGAEISLDDSSLVAGWSGVELRADGTRQRWTTGNTPFPPGTREIEIVLGGAGYYWLERTAEPLAACA